MSKTDAAYMRAYRARKRIEAAESLQEARSFATDYVVLFNDAARERDQLREEVRHLKEELAKRPPSIQDEITVRLDEAREAAAHKAFPLWPKDERIFAEPSFNTRPFTPVPKKGK